jgi:hypothetical protein
MGGAAGLGAAGLGAAGLGAAFGGAGLATTAVFFFAGLLFPLAFLADFFGAAAFDFLADFFAVLAFFADFFADFFEDFFADFFFAVRSFFLFLLFLPPFFFLPLAIMILLLPPTMSIERFKSSALSAGPIDQFILAGDRLSPNREAQPCAPQELTYHRQSAPCTRYCPQQSYPA